MDKRQTKRKQSLESCHLVNKRCPAISGQAAFVQQNQLHFGMPGKVAGADGLPDRSGYPARRAEKVVSYQPQLAEEKAKRRGVAADSRNRS